MLTCAFANAVFFKHTISLRCVWANINFLNALSGLLAHGRGVIVTNCSSIIGSIFWVKSGYTDVLLVLLPAETEYGEFKNPALNVFIAISFNPVIRFLLSTLYLIISNWKFLLYSWTLDKIFLPICSFVEHDVRKHTLSQYWMLLCRNASTLHVIKELNFLFFQKVSITG